ncbi:hypothetical protein O1611_g3985 [Lasiodiplodia mahajangana]|uniref:Uncharacterized protein n=1 Tax=Lasiodiplodia mahajangana TaxID=1108764 RepID=A0ACC2JQN3_9PEZI|nr:hypothetical protein O1611_g3985 [Lasiodiplodia mahajangana]
MLTMTRLPSNSFLPSGGIDCFDRSMGSVSHLNGRPDSVISPFSLPQSIKQPYFEAPNNLKSPPINNHTTSSSLQQTSKPRQYLSAEYHTLPTPPKGTADSGFSMASPSMNPDDSGARSPFGHLSPQTAATLLHRRDEYNRRLLENWQAERAHLEASRSRAEEMFQEERNMMDEERLIWAELKDKLENEIKDWKQKVKAAETRVEEYIKMLEFLRPGVVKSGLAFDGAVEGGVGDRRSGSSIGPGTDGPPTSSFPTPSDGISPTSLPPGRGSTIPESNPFVPLDPRMQSALPTSMASHKEQERVPSIDVNEVIPGLEGIRLKAPAIQKATFNDGKPLSPTAAPNNGSPSNLKKGLTESQSKVSPAVKTQEALKAPEHHRLTMHAGHTPNHSISFSSLPTMDSTAGNTAGSSGASTPTSAHEPKMTQVDQARNQGEPAELPDTNEGHPMIPLVYVDRAIADETTFEPSDDDPALKGPLCLKNRPAADEIFLRRLSDKLEEVKATDATPSVLNEVVTPEPILDLKATNDHIDDSHPEDPLEEVEEDIPLKLRKSSNFGQPLGHVRRSF